MVSNVTLLSIFFLAFAALAAPPSQQGVGLARGAWSQFSNRSDASSRDDPSDGIEFDPRLAGAKAAPETGETFNVATGIFYVPYVSGVNTSAAIFFVNIGDPNCGTGGSLNTGLAARVLNGQVYYNAVYQWNPEPLSGFPTDKILVDDIMRFTAILSSRRRGAVFVENFTQHWIMGRVITPQTNNPICKDMIAQWMVEDPADTSGNYYPLANFGTLTFLDTIAGGPGGYRRTAYDGSNYYDIQQNNQRLTNTYINVIGNAVQLVINYIGSQ